MLLAQGDVEAAVHARPSEKIVQQEERDTAVIEHTERTATEEDVCLMGIFLLFDKARNIVAGLLAARRRCGGRDFTHEFFRPANDLLETDTTHREEEQIRRRVEATHEVASHCRIETGEGRLVAKDIMPKIVPIEKDVLEIVEDKFRGTIEIGVYFIQNHIFLLFHLVRGKNRVEDKVGLQFHSPLEMLLEENRIDESLLLGRIGIQFAANILHAVQDMPGAAFLRPFEKQMLHEMRQAVLFGRFVACPGIDGKAAIRNRRVGGQVH